MCVQRTQIDSKFVNRRQDMNRLYKITPLPWVEGIEGTQLGKLILMLSYK